ncbi:serine hydrolase domain-containing protein [Mariniphaga sediminis]|uniref:serine hydrolase domain-containing protein n=1 Tax=Mariniphaga sediminis TaxID=1628158 RepID=UPI003563CD43
MKRLKISILLLFVICFGFHWNSTAQSSTENLFLGVETSKDIFPGQNHRFSIELDSGLQASGHIKQNGVNLNISVFSPTGKVLLSQDLQKNVHSAEPFSFETTEKGKYLVELLPVQGNIIHLENDKNRFVWDGERRVPYEAINQQGSYSILVEKTDKGKTFSERIDELFRFYDRKEYPGVAMAIVKNDEVIYSKGYGVANVEYDIPVTVSTVFHIASVSKQFAGFALATLHHEGRISLDDAIQEYIPELQIESKITIRQMLNHTSGLRDQWILMALAGWRMDDVITQNQLLKMIYKQKELNFKPGEKYSYSNTNYTLAAQIVHRVTGKTLREWASERIFEPLGMDNTFFYDDHEEIVKNRAYSYDDRSGSLKKSNLNFANTGATGLFTTAGDFSKWLINFNEKNVGNQAIFDLFTTKGILNNGTEIHYALGVALGEYKGHPVIDHSGVDAGYRSFMMFFPEDTLGIVVFSNIASCNTIQLAMKVADICFGIEAKPEVVCHESSETIVPYADTKEIDKNILEQYTGNYYCSELDTRYHFSIKNEKLVASHKRLEDIEFLSKGADIFKGTYWIFDHVEFVRDREGKVYGFNVSNEGVKKITFIKTDGF